MKHSPNLDDKTVAGFGDEWVRFDQSSLSDSEHKKIFNSYFNIFPWEQINSTSQGFDLGCGSGRWAMMVAPKVGLLHCIDPSVAIEVAKKNLYSQKNCKFHKASVDQIPLNDNSMDFGYSLGVLHHIPDTQAGIKSCVMKLKPGAPFLIYLYYSFDNKPKWFQLIWSLSDKLRRLISILPHSLRFQVSQFIALTVYFPLARTSFFLEKLGFNVGNIPLSIYRDLSFYTMRTDALDRFGTRLEQRFSKKQILKMMEQSGLEKIIFSDSLPYWCAVGYKSENCKKV